MKSFALAITLGATHAVNSPSKAKYMNYLAQFGKEWTNMVEFNERLAFFITLDLFIQEHNAEGHSYTLGHNQFSDWSRDEYTSLIGYEHAPQELSQRQVKIFDESRNGDEVNWIKAGAVTPVMDQGWCNAGYAFAAVGALEGVNQIKTGKLESFSKQQIVACSQNSVCTTGWLFAAFNYWIYTSPPATESAYPYVYGDGKFHACDRTVEYTDVSV